MFRIVKYIRIILFSYIFLYAATVSAIEITAIDFNGNVIGQVISTGLVINENGENIGTITADSLIVNNSGDVIGGVVPQGVAIGNDNRFLGKIHGDGIVRSLSGKDLGKSLPNGLIIDKQSEVIGSVLFPGLVYSPEGKTIGRMTGAGTYTNLDGKEMGFISANGYAYRQSGEDFVLDGRLISAKMVVSLEGKFIGSLAPTGAIINFEGKEIGYIRANDFAYNQQGEVIGRLVRTSYAFDLSGKYSGIVSYNGEVTKNGRTIGYYRADGNIVDTNGNVVGFAVDIAAVANDNQGHYLGRLVPGGAIVKGAEVVGHISARGHIYNDNKKIGELIKTGPIYDALSHLKGQIMKNGSVISLNGGVIGRARGKYAFDTNGTLLGGVSSDMLVFDNNNKPLGIANADSSAQHGSEKETISPFGYVFNTSGKVTGQSFDLATVYGLEGLLYSYITPNGTLYQSGKDVKLSSQGILLGKNSYLGGIVDPLYLLDFSGKNLGVESQTNIILNDKGEMIYKMLPGGYVVDSVKTLNKTMAPIKGFAHNKMIALNMGGDLLGYADSNANITDLNGNIFGRVIYGDYVADNNKNVVGQLIPFAVVNNEKCGVIGVVNGHGDIINNREVIIGHLLPNGQAISDVGSYIGYAVFADGLIDFDGHYVGTVSSGRGVDMDGNALGCINRQGMIVSDDKTVRYGIIESNPVIDFDDNLIGHIMANGEVVDAKGQVLGHVQPNGNVVSKSKKTIGQAMKYKVAYDNNNQFLGMVQNNGQVKNSAGAIVGQVLFNGSVQKDGEVVGYALYDFYVYDDSFVVYGYLTKDGVVLSMVGSKLGVMDRGFVLDKNDKVIARGNRDYIVRDVSNNAVGWLQMDGNVLDFSGQNVGYLTETGTVRNSNGDEIAQATPLQYYVVRAKEAVSTERREDQKQDWVDTKKVQITEAARQEEVSKPKGKTSEKIKLDKMGNRIVGIALNPEGDVIGNIYEDDSVKTDDGTQIGFRTPDGIIVDMNYNPIGIEEVKNISADNMFIPANAFGSGNPYGIGSQPSNLGPGGGYGQGERYDPVRMQALKQMQNVRRGQIQVGQVSSNVKVSSFTGYEEDGWPNQNRAISTWRVDMSQMILEDKAIPAVLARSVYASEGFGSNIPVTAIVERNVYAEEGRNIIIPAGSRVIGSLEGEGEAAGNSGGAVKIGITWKRLIRPDGSQFTFNGAQTADAQGRAGALGYLDEQLLKKYSMPLVSTALESTIAYFMASGSGETTSSNGTSTSDSRSQAAEDARQNFINQMDKIIDDIIERKSKIRSVTYIPAGTRIIIFPNQDLWLNSEDLEKKRAAGMDMGEGDDGKTGLLDEDDKHPEPPSIAYSGNVQENVRPVQGNVPNTNTGRTPNTAGSGYPPPSVQSTTPKSSNKDEEVPDLL